jgi:hypothetical protein
MAQRDRAPFSLGGQVTAKRFVAKRFAAGSTPV